MATNEVRIKNEPIHYSESILVSKSSNKQQNKNRSNDFQLIKHERESKQQKNEIKRTRESISSDDNPNNEQPSKRRRQSIEATKIKEETIEIEIQTFKSQMEIKAEKEELANKTSIQTVSIAFLSEETTVTSFNNQATTNNSEMNNPQKKKTNKIENSK